MDARLIGSAARRALGSWRATERTGGHAGDLARHITLAYVSYQAALQTTAAVGQLSLRDFLH